MSKAAAPVGRCLRNDGKGWRCEAPRFGGNRFCEEHQRSYLNSLGGSISGIWVSDPSPVRRKTKRKESARVSEPSIEKKKEEKEKLDGPNGMRAEGDEDLRVRVSDLLAEMKKKKKRGRRPKVKNLDDIEEKNKRGSKRSEIQEMMAKGDAEPSDEKTKKKPGRPPVKKLVDIEEKNERPIERSPPDVNVAKRDADPSGEKMNKKRGRPPGKRLGEWSKLDVNAAKKDAESSGEKTKKKRGRPPVKKLDDIEEKIESPSKRSKCGRSPKKSSAHGAERREEEKEVCRVMELGQVWAFSEEFDCGSPKSYARIDRIIPIPTAVVRVTPLIPHPVTDEENHFAERGLSMACGLFKAAESTVIKEISAFTHRVQFETEEKGSPFFKIFPKKGEIWAIYLRWDGLQKRFQYKLVEVDSDFSEEDGVTVFSLTQVEGMDGFYMRQQHQGFYLVRSFSRGFMSMFSHQVPASRVMEGGNALWKVELS